MFRKAGREHEVFIVHPGGPYWTKKDEGAWTIPKGEFTDEEEALAAAQREFTEETSFIADGPFISLGSVRQKSGKIVHAWAFEGDCDASALVSNTCKVEWPPRSGRKLVIPEVDRGAWFKPHDAEKFLRKEQHPLLDRLGDHLSSLLIYSPCLRLK